jgi:RNA polymerase-interacting CarD/CdnL/TRCF family regulator
MTFKVGETVVYPHHGAALIEAIETRVIKGEEKTYLVLKVAQGDLTVRVPAENVDLVGVRDVVDSAGLDRVFNVLRHIPRSQQTGHVAIRQTWKSLHQEMLLRSPKLCAISTVAISIVDSLLVKSACSPRRSRFSYLSSHLLSAQMKRRLQLSLTRFSLLNFR